MASVTGVTTKLGRDHAGNKVIIKQGTFPGGSATADLDVSDMGKYYDVDVRCVSVNTDTVGYHELYDYREYGTSGKLYIGTPDGSTSPAGGVPIHVYVRPVVV